MTVEWCLKNHLCYFNGAREAVENYQRFEQEPNFDLPLQNIFPAEEGCYIVKIIEFHGKYFITHNLDK